MSVGESHGSGRGGRLDKRARELKKRKKRRERIRRDRHRRRQGQRRSGRDWGPPEGALPSAASQFAMERVLRDVHRALEGRQFAGEDELRQFLATLTGPELKKALAAHELSAAEKAQELAYRAMEAEDPVEAVAMLSRALALDPDCVDARVMAAPIMAESVEERITLLQAAVAAGERSLGPGFFEENRGHFWGMLETRPYMRARGSLAELLRREGRVSEAIAHYEAMLELNPNDNQGVRDPLLGAYLAVGGLEGARRLLRQYEADVSAVFLWGRVLERLASNDLNGAREALGVAREQNRHVEAYLLGKKRMPASMPDYYSLGDQREAAVCAEFLLDAWKAHPTAVAWLRGH